MGGGDPGEYALVNLDFYLLDTFDSHIKYSQNPNGNSQVAFRLVQSVFVLMMLNLFG